MDPVDALHSLIERRKLAPRDMLDIFGTRARCWEILNRKRPLTLAMIRALHAKYRISAAVLITEYETR